MSQESVSPREAEVMTLLGAHLSNAQISGRLHISVRTVENHVSSLLRKYGVADRQALAVIAVPARVTGSPTWRTGFVGREHERDAVLAMLNPGRLVTLAGPGGVGKTRLAAVVATGMTVDAVFVDLVPVRDGQVVTAVATALGLSERPGQSLRDAVTAELGRDRRLLVLDNCEHLLDAVADLADRLLSECPHTTILATSRERLGVPGEQVVPIAPLPLASDAEALFVDRARTVDPAFAAESAVVAEICSRLDGMPLAIELAAARCASLGADGLLAALDDTLRLLVGSRRADERHRSLRAVIGWSHDLLDHEERSLFPRLAVFAGPFDLDAATAVTPGGDRSAVADVLGRLVDKSLVVRGARGWRLLVTVRAYALDQLVADLEEVRDLHLRWAVDTAQTLAERADGEWREDFDAVCDDLRAALSNAPPGAGTLPHRLARSLGRLTYARRLVTEAFEHFNEAARRAPTAGAAAEDLRTAAQAVYVVGLAHGAFDLLTESAARADDHDAKAIALAQAVVTACRFTSGFPDPIPQPRLRELLDQATAIGDATNPAVAAHLTAAKAWCPPSPDPLLAEAAVVAARVTGDPVLISAALDAPGTLALRAGRFRQAHRVARERLALMDLMDRSHPSSAAEILDSFHNAWLCAFATGDLLAALDTAEQITRDDLLGAHPYRSAGKLIPPLVLLGRFDEALEHAEPMWHAWQRSSTPIAAWLSPAASAIALAHGLLGDHAAYLLWRARAERAHGQPASPVFAAFVDARVAVATGGAEDAAALVSSAFTGSPTGWSAAYARAAGAELAVVSGLPDADACVAAAASGENYWAAACLARTKGILYGDAVAFEESLRGWDRIDAQFEREHTALAWSARF